MSEEVETVDGTAVEMDAVVAIPEERQRSAVWKHPDREAIHHLLRRGKSAFWVQCWLEDKYPLVDEDDDGNEIPHPNKASHEVWCIGASALDGYRDRWMPECVAGIDALNDDLQDLIGRRFPGAARYEIEILDATVEVAQKNLVRALESDEQMGMLQQTTMDANNHLIFAAQQAMNAKSQLGMPGYEAAPEHTIQEIHSTNKHLSVELHGRVGKDGKAAPGDPEAVNTMKKLLEMSPEERAQVVEAHRALEAAADDTPGA